MRRHAFGIEPLGKPRVGQLRLREEFWYLKFFLIFIFGQAIKDLVQAFLFGDKLLLVNGFENNLLFGLAGIWFTFDVNFFVEFFGVIVSRYVLLSEGCRNFVKEFRVVVGIP